MDKRDRNAESQATRRAAEDVVTKIGQYFGRPKATFGMEYIWDDGRQPEEPGCWRVTWKGGGPHEWARTFWMAVIDGRKVEVDPQIEFDIEYDHDQAEEALAILVGESDARPTSAGSLNNEGTAVKNREDAQLPTRDFVEIGRQAFRNGDHSAPALNAEVMQALTGLPVGSAEGKQIMTDFTTGWTAANLAAPVPTDLEGSVWSPRDPMSMPLYEGPLSQTHTKLTPGRYQATDEHDNTVIVDVTENASTVTPYDPDNPPRLGPTPAQAVAELAETLNDEAQMLRLARALYCETAEALAVVLDIGGEPALADFLRQLHPEHAACVMDHATGEIVNHNVQRPHHHQIRPSKSLSLQL
ncbi:hypothetical protein ACIA49_39175 [Kribbella sp. NPDC051587]|uniref:hypothetical protein n=1 Tax=Kribbella sp. NPDC051587 TaxID=3364119 RepID=UPI0037986BA9